MEKFWASRAIRSTKTPPKNLSAQFGRDGYHRHHTFRRYTTNQIHDNGIFSIRTDAHKILISRICSTSRTTFPHHSVGSPLSYPGPPRFEYDICPRIKQTVSGVKDDHVQSLQSYLSITEDFILHQP